VEVRSRDESLTDTFDDYFRKAKQPLLAMAFVLTGDIATAQDLTQEALLRTWARWPRVASYDDPLAWTRRVLYNLAMSHKRRDRVRRMAPVEGPGSTAAPSDSHLILATALRSLPENHVHALVLHDGAGLSVGEVARAMKVPEGTVKSWLSRGRTAAAQSMNSTDSRSREGHDPH
jgi:RNA polymerase sigma-70 factor, ECF subfamily